MHLPPAFPINFLCIEKIKFYKNFNVMEYFSHQIRVQQPKIHQKYLLWSVEHDFFYFCKPVLFFIDFYILYFMFFDPSISKCSFPKLESGWILKYSSTQSLTNFIEFSDKFWIKTICDQWIKILDYKIYNDLSFCECVNTILKMVSFKQKLNSSQNPTIFWLWDQKVYTGCPGVEI